MADEESFLARWSQRKLELKRAEVAPADEAATPSEDTAELKADPENGPAEPLPEEPAEPHPTELIDISALNKESDFTIFMQNGVPSAVKRDALRKLWTTDPVLANLDGLNDYDVNVEIMNRAHGFGAFKGSSWQVGKGFGWLDEIAKKLEVAEEDSEAKSEAVMEEEAAIEEQEVAETPPREEDPPPEKA